MTDRVAGAAGVRKRRGIRKMWDTLPQSRSGNVLSVPQEGAGGRSMFAPTHRATCSRTQNSTHRHSTASFPRLALLSIRPTQKNSSFHPQRLSLQSAYFTAGNGFFTLLPPVVFSNPRAQVKKGGFLCETLQTGVLECYYLGSAAEEISTK